MSQAIPFLYMSCSRIYPCLLTAPPPPPPRLFLQAYAHDVMIRVKSQRKSHLRIFYANNRTTVSPPILTPHRLSRSTCTAWATPPARRRSSPFLIPSLRCILLAASQSASAAWICPALARALCLMSRVAAGAGAVVLASGAVHNAAGAGHRRVDVAPAPQQEQLAACAAC